METGPRLKVSSDRLVKPRIEPAIPGLQVYPLHHSGSSIWFADETPKTDNLSKGPKNPASFA